MSMLQSLAGFGNTLAAALAPPPPPIDPTPIRRASDVACLLCKEKEWLNATEQVALIEFLHKDQSAADMALTEAEVRREWVCMQLELLHVIVYGT